jgi:hypothetical protein
MPRTSGLTGGGTNGTTSPKEYAAFPSVIQGRETGAGRVERPAEAGSSVRHSLSVEVLKANKGSTRQLIYLKTHLVLFSL